MSSFSPHTYASDQDVKDVLQKYRDEPLEPLYFSPSIELLMNVDHCKVVSRILQGSGALWERARAVPALGPQLPVEGGLYMFVWTPEVALRFAAAPHQERVLWVLYVGKASGGQGDESGTIRGRYRSEYMKYVGQDPSRLWLRRTEDSRESRLSKYLTLRPLEFWYLALDKQAEIELLERRLIKLLQPPLNCQHGPKLRPGKPGPAF